ncbi:hypothetical protein A2Z41_00810 [Microgenomates group bacterium RBG_19FT_COMBO_39_10]|nr:MAG: hypothetical protein A2Z41_00810 [Microgenomates group bacterium RBG_19FT_COMBO_39_10]
MENRPGNTFAVLLFSALIVVFAVEGCPRAIDMVQEGNLLMRAIAALGIPFGLLILGGCLIGPLRKLLGE